MCTKRFIKSDDLGYVFVYGRVNINMNKSVASLKLQGAVLSAAGGATCGSCGEPFETPLLAMVFSESEVQEYYACPNCLSKVANIQEKPVEPEEVEEAEVDAAEESETVDDVADAVEDEVVDEVEGVEEVGGEEVAEPVAAEVAVEGDVEGPAGCAHYLGYLKKRGKSTPIPEECLTCSKMIDCMY